MATTKKAATWSEWAGDVTGQIADGVQQLQVTVTKQVNDYWHADGDEEEVDDALGKYYKEKHGEVPAFVKPKVTDEELEKSRSRSRDRERRHRRKDGSSSSSSRRRSEERTASSRSGSSRSGGSGRRNELGSSERSKPSSTGRLRSERSRVESSRSGRSGSSSKERSCNSSSRSAREREDLVNSLKKKHYAD